MWAQLEVAGVAPAQPSYMPGTWDHAGAMPDAPFVLTWCSSKQWVGIQHGMLAAPVLLSGPGLAQQGLGYLQILALFPTRGQNRT